MNPQDMQLAQQLKQLGLSDNAIAQAIDMLNRGASEYQVLHSLGITPPVIQGAPHG
jgi:hypothetical protein